MSPDGPPDDDCPDCPVDGGLLTRDQYIGFAGQAQSMGHNTVTITPTLFNDGKPVGYEVTTSYVERFTYETHQVDPGGMDNYQREPISIKKVDPNIVIDDQFSKAYRKWSFETEGRKVHNKVNNIFYLMYALTLEDGVEISKDVYNERYKEAAIGILIIIIPGKLKLPKGSKKAATNSPKPKKGTSQPQPEYIGEGLRMKEQPFTPNKPKPKKDWKDLTIDSNPMVNGDSFGDVLVDGKAVGDFNYNSAEKMLDVTFDVPGNIKGQGVATEAYEQLLNKFEVNKIDALYTKDNYDIFQKIYKNSVGYESTKIKSAITQTPSGKIVSGKGFSILSYRLDEPSKAIKVI